MNSKVPLLSNDSEKIVNPILKSDLGLEVDGKLIEINVLNIGKFFKKVYFLCPLKNEVLNEEIFRYYISTSTWHNLENKLVLYETSIKVLKNKIHFENLSICKSFHFENFNHFGYDLSEEILIVPIFEFSFLNLIDYSKIHSGQNNLSTIHNLLFLKNYFLKDSDFSYASKINFTESIKSMEESYYWTRRYNCMCNITKIFDRRRFQLKYTKIKNDKKLTDFLDELGDDNIENNYLTMIFNNRNFVDAASALKKYGYKMYKIRKSDDFTYSEVEEIFNSLNYSQRFYFFCNILVSKNYCHLVLKNNDILSKIDINYHIELYRYLFGYSWVRFYFEECIKKSYTKSSDDFIFDINSASKLPTFPVSTKNLKSNPYLPIMVGDSSLQNGSGIGGVLYYYSIEPGGSYTNYKIGEITTLDGFRDRFNVFMTGKMFYNIFNDLDLEKLGVGISGSVMAACLQENPPLMPLFKGKNMFKADSTFDLDWSRYFSEYYCDADLDVMIKSCNSIDFIQKVKNIYNQIVVNICNFSGGYADPESFKFNTIRTIFLFVTEDFILEKLCSSGKNLSYDYIVSNLKDEKIIELAKPFFKTYIDDQYKKMFSEFSEEEIDNLKLIHSEIFENNETKYELHLKKGKRSTSNVKSFVELEDSEIEKIIEELDDILEEENKFIDQEDFYEGVGASVTFKVKINATPHIIRTIELFPVKDADFFQLVTKFHLPCVRAYYNGNNLYLTPSCISAHKTYMNLDYKYVAGNKDPIEIINKYRMRGFGTFLNKNEIDKLIKYSSKIEFWNNLYDVKLNNKKSIESCLGSLNLNHKLFHPRLYNADLLTKFSDVDLSDPYNNLDISKVKAVKDSEDFNAYYDKFYPKRCKLDFIRNMNTINENGYIEPLQKWVIDTAFNIARVTNQEFSLKQEEEIPENAQPSIIEYFDNDDSEDMNS